MLYLYIVIGYLLGCIQTGYIVGKVEKGIDIRDYGSGNSGTTNVIRVMGLKYGAITFIGDIAKMIIAINLVAYVFDNSTIAVFVTGLGVIIGHDWPLFLKFKGGKGIASMIGLLLAYDEKVAILIILVLVAIIIVSRYVSLASISISILLPIALCIKEENTEIVILGIIIMCLNIFKHKSNVLRLIKGVERKIGEKNE